MRRSLSRACLSLSLALFATAPTFARDAAPNAANAPTSAQSAPAAAQPAPLLALMPAAGKVQLKPQKIRAVVIGVLAWQDPSITAFSKAERKDQEFYQTLLKRGVPQGNITLLLDEKATRQAIVEALEAQIAATRPDETFLFYYTGHGIDGRKDVLLVPYDYRQQPGIAIGDLDAMLASLKAERALLFADCCFSGALDRVADHLQERGQQAASLTSASAFIPSISNWTFTQTLIESFAGAPSADRNGDQQVTLAEAALEVADAMRFHEYQQSGSTSRPWFDNLVISTAPPADRHLPGPFELYDYVLISYEGKRGMGRLVGTEGENYVVELQAYNARVPLEVPAEYLQPLPSPPSTVLPPREAEQKASVGGNYSELLRKIEVEPDFIQFGDFHERGLQPAVHYRGYPSLPEGYWVYVYPNWYIWAESLKAPLTPPEGSE